MLLIAMARLLEQSYGNWWDIASKVPNFRDILLMIFAAPGETRNEHVNAI